jgi:hypothetical protein
MMVDKVMSCLDGFVDQRGVGRWDCCLWEPVRMKGWGMKTRGDNVQREEDSVG